MGGWNLFPVKSRYNRPRITIAMMLSNYCMKLSFCYGSTVISPAGRLQPNQILSSLHSRSISHQLVNNAHIAYNCTKIALKYSKCYLCRLPGIRAPIRRLYKIEKEKQHRLDRINRLFAAQCPIPKLAPLLKNFHYENKGIYSSLSLFTKDLTSSQQKQAINFLTALELVNLGYALHYSVGKSYKLNFVSRIALRLMSKQMKDSYLVLGGDYMHIQGSVLAAETNNVRLSELMSEAEIDLCKYAYKLEQLKKKIEEKGYSEVEVSEIHDISVLKTSPLVIALKGMGLIQNSNADIGARDKEAYECLGLLMLYRRDLENFMFNFKSILSKYLEYNLSGSHIALDCEQSLPYFIFFKGAQDQRIDVSYLNTVTLMSKEIEHLEMHLRELVGEEAAASLQSRLKYYLMTIS